MITCLEYSLSQQFILSNNVYLGIINFNIIGNHGYISHNE